MLVITFETWEEYDEAIALIASAYTKEIVIHRQLKVIHRGGTPGNDLVTVYVTD